MNGYEEPHLTSFRSIVLLVQTEPRRKHLIELIVVEATDTEATPSTRLSESAQWNLGESLLELENERALVQGPSKHLFKQSCKLRRLQRSLLVGRASGMFLLIG